jgi:hypothetical protein
VNTASIITRGFINAMKSGNCVAKLGTLRREAGAIEPILSALVPMSHSTLGRRGSYQCMSECRCRLAKERVVRFRDFSDLYGDKPQRDEMP